MAPTPRDHPDLNLHGNGAPKAERSAPGYRNRFGRRSRGLRLGGDRSALARAPDESLFRRIVAWGRTVSSAIAPELATDTAHSQTGSEAEGPAERRVRPSPDSTASLRGHTSRLA